jgi:hypothetical protein
MHTATTTTVETDNYPSLQSATNSTIRNAPSKKNQFRAKTWQNNFLDMLPVYKKNSPCGLPAKKHCASVLDATN